MRTRSQSRNLNRQQQQAPPAFVEPFNLEEPIENPAPPVVTMDDNRTMAQLLEAPTEGYEDAIVVPEALKSAKPQVQDKGKAIIEEPEKPTKRKDQIRHDEEVGQRLQAQMQAELKENDRLVRQREEKANIISWDNVQAMIDADYQMAQQMQEEEQEKLSIEEKSKLFVQLLEARKKHFPAMRAQEKSNKPPTNELKKKKQCLLI
ncbi:hypothetical protein Tco_0378376 [Tanacetum coccineum]